MQNSQLHVGKIFTWISWGSMPWDMPPAALTDGAISTSTVAAVVDGLGGKNVYAAEEAATRAIMVTYMAGGCWVVGMPTCRRWGTQSEHFLSSLVQHGTQGKRQGIGALYPTSE